jgi:Protein of unknown function (DUF2911)
VKLFLQRAPVDQVPLGYDAPSLPVGSGGRMMRRLVSAVAVLSLFSAVAYSQKEKPSLIGEDGGLQERGLARVLYWNPQQDTAHGQFAIDYGRPVWKKDYADPAKFDQLTKGKVWRLGSNFWTVLDTQLPLKIGARNVSAGYYYLGLRRSADGAAWSLVFIDPSKVRSARLDAFQIERAPVEFEIPMTVEEGKENKEKLTLTLSYGKETPKDVKLTIAWGKLQLSAPIQVTVGT